MAVRLTVGLLILFIFIGWCSEAVDENNIEQATIATEATRIAKEDACSRAEEQEFVALSCDAPPQDADIVR